MNIEDQLRDSFRPLMSTEPPPDVVDRATRHLPKRPSRRVTGSFATATALVALLAVLGAVVVSLPRRDTPPGSSIAPEQTVPAVAGEATHQVMPTELPLTPTTLHPTSSPITGTELERSDLFWDTVISGDNPDEIESLSGGFSGADLVVVGRFTEAAFEHDPALDELGDYPLAGATFTIEQVLKGQPETEVEGTIRVQFNPVVDTQLVQQLMPTHQHVLFLFYVPSFLERLNQPPDEQERYRYRYMLMHGKQGVIRNVSGTTRVLDARNPNRFPAGFEGVPFDVVLETIRLAAPEAAEASSSIN